jgi:ribonucleotide monophosphatase NagD (HAD superfamily)
MEFVTGLSQLASKYDSFVFDQFGVLHDGVRPLDEALHVVSSLVKLGKYVSVLSNSPARASFAAKRLAAIGFSPDSALCFLISLTTRPFPLTS